MDLWLVELPVASDGLRLLGPGLLGALGTLGTLLGSVEGALLRAGRPARALEGAGGSVVGELELLLLLVEEGIVLLRAVGSTRALLLQLLLPLQVELGQGRRVAAQGTTHRVRVGLLRIGLGIDGSNASGTASHEAALGWPGAVGVECACKSDISRLDG